MRALRGGDVGDGTVSLTTERRDNSSWGQDWSRNAKKAFSLPRIRGWQANESADSRLVNESSGSDQARLFSSAFAFDTDKPYWGWAYFIQNRPSNVSLPTEKGEPDMALLAEGDEQSIKETRDDETEVERLRREVEVLRLALLRERSTSMRLSEKIEKDAAARAASIASIASANAPASNKEEEGNWLSGMGSSVGGAIYSNARLVGGALGGAGGLVGGAVSGVAGFVGGTVMNVSSIAISSAIKLGASAQNSSQRINTSRVWQFGNKTANFLLSSLPISREKQRVQVRTMAEFNALLKSGVSIDDIDVRGRSQPWRQNEQGEVIPAKSPNFKSAPPDVQGKSLGMRSSAAAGDIQVLQELLALNEDLSKLRTRDIFKALTQREISKSAGTAAVLKRLLNKLRGGYASSSSSVRKGDGRERQVQVGATQERDRRGDGRERQLQHPVLRAIWERKKSGSKPGARSDGYKIALAIEGGGLRGSVTAGMSHVVSSDAPLFLYIYI